MYGSAPVTARRETEIAEQAAPPSRKAEADLSRQCQTASTLPASNTGGQHQAAAAAKNPESKGRWWRRMAKHVRAAPSHRWFVFCMSGVAVCRTKQKMAATMA